MLNYTDTSEPGIVRRKRGKHWHYFATDGSRITAKDEIARLNKLGVPPAYARVWYSPDPSGHLQAVGFDAKGRKQYRYHEDFRQQREADKYSRCGGFGEALPGLRAIVERDIAVRGLGRTKVLAAIVRLLDSAYVRVGNDVYASENESYGATTLLAEHSAVRGDKVKLEYRGKSGKMQRVVIADEALAKIVRRCHDLPGQALFQYVGDDGEPHRIGSSDVNAYIREGMGDGFSAKHFRTWGASVIAFTAIRDGAPTLKAMLEPVAAALGNTPAISRKSYVHPALIALVNDGRTGELVGTKLPRPTRYLSAAERGLIAFLATATAA
ncbi:MAG: DNA topoisomerase IB [Janthinobacterium lividum]